MERWYLRQAAKRERPRGLYPGIVGKIPTIGLFLFSFFFFLSLLLFIFFYPFYIFSILLGGPSSGVFVVWIYGSLYDSYPQ